VPNGSGASAHTVGKYVRTHSRQYAESTERVRRQWTEYGCRRKQYGECTDTVRIESTDHLISRQHFVFAVPPYYHAEAEEAEAAAARSRSCCCCITRIRTHARRRRCIAGIARITVKEDKSRAVFLTPEQEQDVADCYKDCEWLYNFRCEAYKDTVRKNKALEEKAAQLGYTAQDLKTWIKSKKKDLAAKILKQNTSVGQ